MFTISENQKCILKDGKPHFFRLDTAWMAFTNLTVEEFEEYVSFRAQQGYNGLLLQNTPALHDMTTHVKYQPFKTYEDGSYDFRVINEEYFRVAVQKLELMEKYKMTPFLSPMWMSFVPPSESEEYCTPVGKVLGDETLYHAFLEYSIETYKRFHPVWMIGGDAKLDQEHPIYLKYYGYMAQLIREKCPEDLITAHINDHCNLDPIYAQSGYVDFYTYQSGHSYNEHSDLMLPVKMAEVYRQGYPKKPIMNLEPMYEAHGYGHRFLRFDNYFIRRAFWYSVLSGANSGFAYGAHGIWMFYDGTGFTSEHWSKLPLLWRSSLKLPGAYDVIDSAALFEQYHMFELEPCQSINVTGYEEIRTAATEDQNLIVTYTPCTQHIDLTVDLTQYKCTWYLLGEKITEPAVVRKEGNISIAEMYQYNSDGVLVCEKKQEV